MRVQLCELGLPLCVFSRRFALLLVQRIHTVCEERCDDKQDDNGRFRKEPAFYLPLFMKVKHVWYYSDNTIFGTMLYHRRTKAVIKWVWIALSIVMIISMVFVYSGGSSLL